MNNDDKRALISFITIYTLSSILLITIIAFLYYEKEMDRQKKVCKNDLQNCVMKVESQLLKAKLTQTKFIFSPKTYKLNIGLFDANKKLIQSSLQHPKVDLNNMMIKKPDYVQLVYKLDKALFSIQYIISEDISMPRSQKSLLSLIMIVIFFSGIFIAFIGYLLSKLLLKPVKEKMRHLDNFIKDSAHEINTPIASLLMSVSALKKKGGADPKILNHISISSKQISDVYNSLSHLAFSDIAHNREITEINFKDIVEKSVEFYSEIAKSKHCLIHTSLQDTPLMIDKEDAKKLINNLLSNAVKYNNTGKQITVTLEQNILSVKDEGIGIDAKEQKIILKRYQRSTDLFGGFGIGLDIVNSICHTYNIPMKITSKKHQGSTFSIDFRAIAVKT